MRTLPIPLETDALRLARKNYPHGPREKLLPADRITLRERLLENQSSTCGWCEAPMDLESSHVDHIIPIDKDPKLTFVMENLVASCEEKDTCGHNRGSQLLPDWIHPYNTSDLESQFYYDKVDGSLKTSKAILIHRVTEANKAINDLLNLNADNLKAKRTRHMANVHDYVKQGFHVDEILQFLEGFPSLTRQLLS